MRVFFKRISSGKYDESKVLLTTYAVPFIGGAIRCFDSLSKREKDIIGKSFGAYDYPKESLWDIAMYHMIKEGAVEKAKHRVQKKLLEMYDSDE